MVPGVQEGLSPWRNTIRRQLRPIRAPEVDVEEREKLQNTILRWLTGDAQGK